MVKSQVVAGELVESVRHRLMRDLLNSMTRGYTTTHVPLAPKLRGGSDES